MNKSADAAEWERLRARILGLGEASIHKSHYPELQRRLAELQESEEKYRSLVNNINVGILRTVPDERGTILEANPTVARILGVESVAEMMEAGVRPFYADPRDRTAFLDRVARDGEVRGMELILRRRDGGLVSVSVSGTGHFNADGRLAFIDFACEDVTERRRLETELAHAQKVEALGRLAGGVAHDFNNLLTAIIGYQQMLLDGLPEGSPARQPAEEIGRAADRAARMTKDLLAFARKQVLRPRLVDLNRIVASLEGLLHQACGEQVELRLALADDPWKVKADPTQIEQVLLNLALNARDAMPDGGTLTIETRNVLRGAALPGLPPAGAEGAALLVRDTGVGVPAEVKKRIFEPFFTTKPAGKGTGLGLAMVDGIVQQSGGLIGLDSEPGRGSVFSVYLPRALSEREQEEERPSGPTPGGRELVLLAEDEAAVRTLMAGVLRRAGYAVLEVRDGQEALDRLSGLTSPPDIVVADLGMPHVGGLALAERLAVAAPNTPFLFVSGYGEAAAGKIGGRPLLEKPFSPQTLLAKVRELLDR